MRCGPQVGIGVHLDDEQHLQRRRVPSRHLEGRSVAAERPVVAALGEGGAVLIS